MRYCALLLVLVALWSAVAAAADCSFNASYPRSYVALAASTSPVIDGFIDDDFWRDAPWTEPFVDISTSATPPLLTRAKIRWDAKWLCVSPSHRSVADSLTLDAGTSPPSCRRQTCGQTSRALATALILLTMLLFSTTMILRSAPSSWRRARLLMLSLSHRCLSMQTAAMRTTRSSK